MKKLKSLTLIFVLCLFSAFMLCACSERIIIEGLSFEGASYVYDGTPKTISVTGLPQGASLVYDTATTYTDAGIYPVAATITTQTGDKIVLKATLTITKAKYDMSGISFDSQAFIYDGNSKSIEIEGNLPEGVTVSYENNEKTDAGSYTAIAKFTSSNKNYEQIPNMVASYVIYDATGLPSYEIIFDTNGGSAVEKQTVLHGGLITQPQNPTKNEYNFNGWYYNDRLWNFDSNIVDKKITLVAKWKSVYTYTKNESGGITLAGYTGNATEVVFPEAIDGFTVTEIGNISISNSVTSITIPRTARKINNYAFSSNKNLVSITISNGVEDIGSDAFGGCTSLKSIIIPESVRAIGDNAFYGCTSLESVEILNGTTAIGNYAFKNCEKLKTLMIPDSVVSLGSGAFDGCTSLEYTTKNNVRYLGSSTNPYLFLVQGIDSTATSVTIQAGVRFILSNAFKNFSKLTSVTLPDTVVAIGSYAFSECHELSSINLPSGISRIENGTFSGCQKLKSITIPQNVSYIGGYAFKGCATIEAISIPDNVITIGNSAFENASRLKSLNISASSKLENIGKNFILFTSIKSIYIPKNVKKLVTFSIYNSDLETVIIGKDTQLEEIEHIATWGDVTTVYFGGSAEDWIDINIHSDNTDLLNATRYYYSETKPTESGNYWYYDEKTGTPVIW